MSFVALTSGDTFLRVVGDGHGPVLRADAPALDRDGVFERVDLGHGRVALRTPDGRWLASRPHGSADPGVRPEDELTACAAFEELPADDDAVFLRTCDRTYLGVDAHGAVVTDRIAQGWCERFAYAAVPAELLPAGTAAGTGAGVPAQGRGTEEPIHPALA